MGDIDFAVAEAERFARELVPSGFEVRRVELARVDPEVPSPTPFAIVACVVRGTDEPEPGGWAYTLAERARGNWQRDDFHLSVRVGYYVAK